MEMKMRMQKGTGWPYKNGGLRQQALHLLAGLHSAPGSDSTPPVGLSSAEPTIHPTTTASNIISARSA